MPSHLHLAPDPAREDRHATDAPITVVIAESHTEVRRSLRSLLDAERDMNLVADSSELSIALQCVHDAHPHALVVDLRMMNGSGVEAISRLRAQAPSTGIVVLTMHESPLFAQRALDAGALGFVLKDRADAELVEAIRRAARGEEYVSPRVADGLGRLRRAVDGDALNSREIEVLRLIALGHTSAEMAGKLRVSRRTVEAYRARLHTKLGLRTRAELVQVALRRHLIGT
jgi:two-component system, NarL family, response regulator NreC